MNTTSTVCFLRGINVSGKNMIKMADLAALFKRLGFSNVSTYLQSGNVVFSHRQNLNEPDLKELVASGIKRKFGNEIPVLFRDIAEIDRILKRNDFLNNEKPDSERLYVTMLERNPDPVRVGNLKLTDYSPERFEIKGRDIYLFCPAGYGRAKLNNNFFEKKLDSTATTRNWKTITAIAGMMELIG